jgi:hypothetical protein
LGDAAAIVGDESFTRLITPTTQQRAVVTLSVCAKHGGQRLLTAFECNVGFAVDGSLWYRFAARP